MDIAAKVCHIDLRGAVSVLTSGCSKSMRVTKGSSESWRPAWFDVLHLPPCPNCSVVGSEASLTQITRIIEDESRLLTEPKSVFLVGFSQGAALSMVLSLTTLIDLGGVASLSGWIPHHCRPVCLFLSLRLKN